MRVRAEIVFDADATTGITDFCFPEMGRPPWVKGTERRVECLVDIDDKDGRITGIRLPVRPEETQ